MSCFQTGQSIPAGAIGLLSSRAFGLVQCPMKCDEIKTEPFLGAFELLKYFLILPLNNYTSAKVWGFI